MHAVETAGSEKPAIFISETDYDIIADLALRAMRGAPAVSELLMAEIERAVVHPRATLPGDVVTLGSEVEFEDESSGARRRVRLVLPADADIESGMISILTPIGAGLIGMRVDARISWPCRDGRMRLLKILEVNQAQ